MSTENVEISKIMQNYETFVEKGKENIEMQMPIRLNFMNSLLSNSFLIAFH